MSLIKSFFLIILLTISIGCDHAKQLEFIINEPDRKPIDKSLIGLNNFFNQPFGSISDQYNEIVNGLGIRDVRILLAADNGFAPAPGVLNFGFIDSIIKQAPPGVRFLVVISHSPDWVSNSSDPVTTWVDNIFLPSYAHVSKYSNVIGVEVWNEPNMIFLSNEVSFGLDEPENYFRMLQRAYSAAKKINNHILVLNAASTSITQKFPDSFNYNKTLVELGAANYTDIWNIHLYGDDYVALDEVGNWLRDLNKPIWVTESGKQGGRQQEYVERVWTFLLGEVKIDKFYYYETYGVGKNSFALRAKERDPEYTDLYLNLAEK